MDGNAYVGEKIVISTHYEISRNHADCGSRADWRPRRYSLRYRGGTATENDEDCVTAILVGSAIGIVLAQALDAAFIAYSDEDPKPITLQLGIKF